MPSFRLAAWVLLAAVLPASVCCAQPERFGLPDRLRDLTVLGDIAQRSDLSPFDYTETLGMWLIREHRDPSPTRRGLGGPIDSGWILSNIITALFVKGDPLAIAEIAGDSQVDPALRDAMRIVLGLKGDSSQRETLVTILQTHPIAYYRAKAARALGALGATEAIPPLEEALKDEYVVEVWPCVGPPENNLFYPVRQYAAESLRVLRDAECISASRERSERFARTLKSAGETLVDLTTYVRPPGWEIAWQKDHQEVVAVNRTNNIRVVISDGYASVNGSKVTVAVAPTLRDARVLVPRSLGVMLAYKSSPLWSLARLPTSG